MGRPTVSVVMPSYNQARFLDEAIRSVLAQRDEIHEFFVLDGGSTDGSRGIIESYAGSMEFWRCEKDNGQSDAIAQGFARATGDVLTWINSDDALLPGAVAAARDAFAADASLGFVEGDTLVIDEDSRVIRCDKRAGPSKAWARFGYLRVHQPSSFFRRDVFERVGGLDPDLHCAMDTDLWYRILDVSGARRLPCYTGVHRVQPDAKGEDSAWDAMYKAEWKLLDERYPTYRKNPVRYQLGRAAYTISSMVNRRPATARADTARCKGKTLDEIVAQRLIPMNA